MIKIKKIIKDTQNTEKKLKKTSLNYSLSSLPPPALPQKTQTQTHIVLNFKKYKS